MPAASANAKTAAMASDTMVSRRCERTNVLPGGEIEAAESQASSRGEAAAVW